MNNSKRMKIYLISGKAQHGKDLSAELIKENSNKGIILHFADLLKYVAKTFHGWDGKKDDVGRELLQQLGTDKIRKKNKNYWPNFIGFQLQFCRDMYDIVAIPDFRFKNEYDTIAKLTKEYADIITVRIERPLFDNGLSEVSKAHKSETSLDNYSFDYVIKNDKDVAALNKKIIKMMKGKQ